MSQFTTEPIPTIAQGQAIIPAKLLVTLKNTMTDYQSTVSNISEVAGVYTFTHGAINSMAANCGVHLWDVNAAGSAFHNDVYICTDVPAGTDKRQLYGSHLRLTDNAFVHNLRALRRKHDHACLKHFSAHDHQL